MIRVTKMSGKYYGIELTDDLGKEMEQIADFVNQGTPVIIINSKHELEDLDIYEDIIMVDRED